MSRRRILSRICHGRSKSFELSGGGPREDRTPNPLIKSQLLCQLSYRPAMFLPNRSEKLNSLFHFRTSRTTGLHDRSQLWYPLVTMGSRFPEFPPSAILKECLFPDPLENPHDGDSPNPHRLARTSCGLSRGSIARKVDL